MQRLYMVLGFTLVPHVSKICCMYAFDNESGRARVTCDITKPQPGAFKTLEIEMGIADKETAHDAIVTVFFNGQEVFNESVQKGPLKKLSLDVRKVRTVTIEAWYPQFRGFPNYVHFVKAELVK